MSFGTATFSPLIVDKSNISASKCVEGTFYVIVDKDNTQNSLLYVFLATLIMFMMLCLAHIVCGTRWRLVLGRPHCLSDVFYKTYDVQNVFSDGTVSTGMEFEYRAV